MQKFMGKEYEGLEEGDYNPQSEIRYKTPEELELSKSSEEELLNFIGDIKNGRTDLTAAEEPVVLKWVKEELEKRKNPKEEEPNDNGEITEDDFDDDELHDQMESMGDLPSDMQLHKTLKKVDTNDNGEVEVDEMADFQKSLDDYASKNKKGRDDIPVTARRR